MKVHLWQLEKRTHSDILLGSLMLVSLMLVAMKGSWSAKSVAESDWFDGTAEKTGILAKQHSGSRRIESVLAGKMNW